MPTPAKMRYVIFEFRYIISHLMLSLLSIDTSDLLLKIKLLRGLIFPSYQNSSEPALQISRR